LRLLDRWLARQFAQPDGVAGQWLVGPLIDRIGAPMMRTAAEALAVQSGERVLDLGFGGGGLSAAVLRQGGHIVGVDRSAAMVRRAERLLAPAVASGRARFLEGSADALPLPNVGLDKAASVNTLYFWPDLARPIGELHRVLKPGGRLVLGFQTAEAVRAWPGHVHGFTAWETGAVREALGAGGFKVLHEQGGRDWRVGDYVTVVALRAG
jgi:SAM-dependent methyltransferase